MPINLVCKFHEDPNTGKGRLLERNRYASGVLFRATQGVRMTGFAQFEPAFEKFFCAASPTRQGCIEHWDVELEGN